MGGNRGKLASMAGHAYLHAYWDAVPKYETSFPSRRFGSSDPEPRKAQALWMKQWEKRREADIYRASEMAKKITLKVDTTDQLNDLYEQLKDLPFGNTLVVDRGLTVFEGPTTVCIGFGPVAVERVPDVLKRDSTIVKMLL